MKAERGKVEEFYEDRREQMLAGMLLHVIVAARPMNFAAHRTTPDRRSGHVGNAVLFVDYIGYFLAAKPAYIMGLSTRSGVKGGSV